MKKSSAENKPTGRLEDVFRQQFNKAEVTPPADLWGRLEHDLDVQDKNTYRKGMLRYRNIAAVALVLLLATAALLTRNLLNNSGTNQNLAVDQEKAERRKHVSQETSPPNRPQAGAGIAGTASPNLNSTQTPAAQLAQKASAEGVSSEKNTAGNNGFAKHAPGLKPEPKTYAYAATGRKSPAKKSGHFSPNLKPEVKEGSAAGTIALAARSTGTAGTKETLPASEGDSGSNKPAAQAAKQATEQPAIAATPANTGKPATETNAGPTGIARTEKEPAAPEKPAEPAVAVAAPDTSKQQLPHLAALPETEKPEPDKNKPDVQGSKWVLLADATPQLFKQNIMLRPGSGNGIQQNALVSGPGTSFETAIADYETNTHSTFSYQFQVGAGYRIRPEWMLQGGIGFMQNKARTEANYEIREKPSIGSSLQQQTGYPVAVAMLFHGIDSMSGRAVAVEPYLVQYRYRYIHIPVQIAYQGSRQNWLYQVSAGLAANWLISYKIGEKQNESQAEAAAFTTNSYDSGGVFNTFLPQALASAKIGYQVNRNWQLLAGPSVAFGLRPLITESNGNLRATSPNSPGAMHGQEMEQKNPVNLGFAIGLQYSFLQKNK